VNAQSQPEPKQDQPSRSQQRKGASDYSSTESRVVRLETRWETVIPNLATKHDLSDLRADLKDSIARSESKTADAIAALRVEVKDANASLLRWVVGTMLAGLGGVVAIMALLLSVMMPKPVAPAPAPAPQPAVIAAPQPMSVQPPASVQPAQPDQPATPERMP